MHGFVFQSNESNRLEKYKFLDSGLTKLTIHLNFLFLLGVEVDYSSEICGMIPIAILLESRLSIRRLSGP